MDAGYTHSFCTPHIWPNLPNNKPSVIAEKVAELQPALDDNFIALTLARRRIEHDRSHRFPCPARFGDLRAGRFASVDRSLGRQAAGLFRRRGPAPSVAGRDGDPAHPERMYAVQNDPAIADHFAELGMLLQCNLQCLGDPPHAATRKTAEQYLAENRYFMLGSDLHNLTSLPLRLRGLSRAVELLGEEKVGELTRDNPKKLLINK